MFSLLKPIAASLSAAVLLAGCDVTLKEAYESEYSASVGFMTAQNRALRAIPQAHHPVTVAVYGMPDLTGQYKESNNGQTLSRAVTQGGSAVLIKALHDAGNRGWFKVLDRSNLDNLIRERQIVTEMRRIYRNEEQIDPSVLGPLSHSAVLIEGAIVGYDTNTLTGGQGARYLGIGANRRWKLDTVTVSLRAVSTETSEVLASVVTRKPIASIADQGSVFTYVALDEIIEAEAGKTMNEPKQIAIEQAVEKAVMAMIAEGARIGLWKFANAAEGASYVSNYLAQKYDGDVPSIALHLQQSYTHSAVHIPVTRAIRPVARPTSVSERRLPPVQVEPAAPPSNTPDSEEALG